MPGSHRRQSLSEREPASGAKVPCGHGSQVSCTRPSRTKPACCTRSLYEPGWHRKHWSPISSEPLSHTHCSFLLLPSGETRFTSHGVHSASKKRAEKDEYVFSGHRRHRDAPLTLLNSPG